MTAVPVPSSPSTVLRQAAKLMRERAEKATGGPWHIWATSGDGTDLGDYAYVQDLTTDMQVRVESPTGFMTAEHIASWHPAVALGFAGVLEATADEMDDALVVALLNPDDNTPSVERGWRIVRTWAAAFAVARAYLGTTEGTETP